MTGVQTCALPICEALNAAREAEHRCLARLDAMQAQLDAIQVRQDHPPQSTTVTTAVTTVAPVLPVEGAPA